MNAIEHVFTGCDNYTDDLSHDCRWSHDGDLDSWCRYCLQDEVESLRDLLISCEGYAIANGADRPFIYMYVAASPLAAVIERAGTYPRDARREHPGPLALNRPPEARDG